MESSVIRSCSAPLVVEAAKRRDIPSAPPAITCSTRNRTYIPKLEPFSRTKVDRIFKEPPLIQKCESEIADYCSTLEGDQSYSCWRAYFELKDLEKDYPKEDLERLIIQAGGVKSLIGCLHGISEIHRGKKDVIGLEQQSISEDGGRRNCPIPDGLPKTPEELEEEEMGRMPDSPFTRLLRSKGRHPAWYSPVPDHETD